eukprot:6197177-Pleurochrysis_carterae.AAC.2
MHADAAIRCFGLTVLMSIRLQQTFLAKAGERKLLLSAKPFPFLAKAGEPCSATAACFLILSRSTAVRECMAPRLPSVPMQASLQFKLNFEYALASTQVDNNPAPLPNQSAEAPKAYPITKRS